MQNTNLNDLANGGDQQPQRRCPTCGNANNDWHRTCLRCGNALPDQKDAVQAEIGHVLYLLHRLTDWQSRGLLPMTVASRLSNETLDRQRGLFTTLTELTTDAVSHAVVAPSALKTPPVVPPLPPRFASAPSPIPAPAPVARVQTWAARTQSRPAVPPVVPPPPPTAGLRNFMQKYAIQTLFLLAAILVLTSMRSLIAWDAVGAIAIRLIPLIPLGLTWMFWSFGQHTRKENPWAAFIYHSLAATLTAFDLVAVHRYWLGDQLLWAKPLFLLAACLATGTAGLMLQREKRIPYLHLFLTGVLISLFAALQLIRLFWYIEDDFHVVPLPLFGIAYLLVGAFCVWMARKSRVALQNANSQQGNRGIGMDEPQDWASVWMLWSHLSVMTVVLLCAIDLALQEKIGTGDYGLLALLTSILYGIMAQAMDEPKMVTVSGGLLLVSGALWLGEWGRMGETTIGYMLLSIGGIGAALSAYNVRRQQGAGEALSVAWRRLAQGTVIGATALVWFSLLERLGMFVSESVPNQAVHAVVQSTLCSGFLMLFARWERQQAFVVAALSTGGAALVHGLLRASAPPIAYALTLSLYGALLYGVSLRFPEKQQQGDPTTFSVGEWGAAFRDCGFISMLLALGECCQSFFVGNDPLRLAVSFIPVIAALALIAVTRRAPKRDTLRTIALGAIQFSVALAVGTWCGLTHGMAHWTTMQIQNWGLALVATGWAWWAVGQALDRRQNDLWGETLANGGLTTAFFAGLMITGAATVSSAPVQATWWMWQGGLLGIFALFAYGTYRTQREPLVLVPLVVTGFSGLVTAVHSGHVPFAATVWTGFALLATGVTLLLARRLESIMAARLSWLPFFGGYALMELLQAMHPASRLDGMMANAGWLLGGIAATIAWLKTARWSNASDFSYASALTLCGVYLRTLTWFWHPQPEWHALLLLPFLMALYIAGTRFKPEDDLLLGQPLRRTAEIVSGLALLWSAGNGDGSLLALRHASAWIVTLTLCAYGVAYALLAAYRRTQLAVGIGASMLTATYLHYLLTLTPAMDKVTTSLTLSWSHFAFLAIQAGLFWLTVGWIVRVRLQQKDLASPLLLLAGSVALFSVIFAITLGLDAHAEGFWSILTLAWGGAVWFGLWLQDQGEICLHVGTWNLLAAWMMVLYSRVGWETALLDLYMLPVGLYLVAIGHRASHKKQEGASFFWWSGLLLMLSPTYLAYWNHAAGWHTVLLIIECLAAVVWGIAQRIRAFVSAGLLFAMLFAVPVILGHHQGHAGTVVALLIGVGLFVAGYYALTRREMMQRWMAVLERQWQAWQAWR